MEGGFFEYLRNISGFMKIKISQTQILILKMLKRKM
jgi:hypothetical protein